MINSKDDERVAAASLLELCSGATSQKSPLRKGVEVCGSIRSSGGSIDMKSKSQKEIGSGELSVFSVESKEVEQEKVLPQDEQSCCNAPQVSLDKVNTIIQEQRIIGRSLKVPEILMELLTNINQYQGFMWFLPDEKSFVISNTRHFIEEVMPKYFKMTKFGCFLNKLTKNYGFTHTVLDHDQHLFFHPFFHKGDWESLQIIKYKPRSESGKMEPFIDHSRKRKGPSNNNDVPSPHKASRLGNQINLKVTRPSPMNHDPPLNSFTNSLFSTAKKDTLSSLFSSSPSLDSLESFNETDLMHNATKNVVAKAIDCLLYDETHTLDLLARRGEEVQSRRLSLPAACNHVQLLLGNSQTKSFYP